MKKPLFAAVILCLSLMSCKTSSIYPDRSQFIKDGDFVPTIRLGEYKSVQLRPGQDEELAVAMAISGGGSRAANFGIGIMLGLERIGFETKGNALKEVDYISTVSGGGFAGGAYINSLYEHRNYRDFKTYSLRKSLKYCIKEDLSNSYVKYLVGATFKPWYWFSKLDDGDALEKAIDDHVLGYKRRKSYNKKNKDDNIKTRSLVLGDIFVDKDDTDQEVLYPMFFANATVWDKMAIFPFSPDILETYKIVGYDHRLKRNKYIENFSPYDMPIAVGIKASGSFPVLISNTTMVSDYHDKRKYLHVLDGAMSDNNGYRTAVDVLMKDPVKRKVLFLIDADNAGMHPTFSKKGGGHFSMKVLGRLGSSGLDARHVTLEQDILLLGQQMGFESVFFSFNRLIKDNPAKPPQSINIKEEGARLTKLLETDIHNISQIDLQILYELVTNIGTKYTITEEEQALLLLTGQKVVLMQEELIKRIMGKE